MADRQDAVAASEHEVKLVDRGCPTCGAPPGDFCHTPTGKPRSDHARREYEEVEADGDE